IVYWFTYDESGRQRWFIATGTVESDTIVFETLLQTGGPTFGEGFDPDAVVYSEVGELSVTWTGCSSATATYTVNGVAGSQSLVRITTLAGLECDEPASTPSSRSGSWFDHTHNGEGLIIEALPDGRVLVYWFSYNRMGEQAWFFGVGVAEGNVVTIPAMFVTSGGRFGPDFDPDQVREDAWGSLVVELGCDYGKFDYASHLEPYGSGKQTLNRITNPGEPACEEPSPPNILLVIADDLGKDASNQYDISAERPVTPTLDQLAASGLVFDNAWSSPTCSPTRAGILTGKYSTRTGVFAPTDELSVDETSLQSYIGQHLPGRYSDAVIGKWHLGPQPGGLDHPSELGVSHFAGIIGGGVSDYEDWTLVQNGERQNENRYVTSKLVDLAVEWTGAQEIPWFLWLAFNAPHTPFHLPPNDLHNRNLSGTEADIENDPLPYYFAAIEAMDTELGRLLDSLDANERDNTVVIFMGDNGTPNQVAQPPFARRKVKGSLYQGGVNIPLFVTGPVVTRIGEREAALVNTTDLFATIASLAGVNIGQVNDSISFDGLFSETGDTGRLFQFSEQSLDEDGDDEADGERWALSDGMYKLIETTDGSRELYHLMTDPYEGLDLVTEGTAPDGILDDLQYLAGQVRHEPVKAPGYAVVDTGQTACYDDSGAETACPGVNDAFYGQDAHYEGNAPDYADNGDGTVSDLVTGLVWQRGPDTNLDEVIDVNDKLTFTEAGAYCDNLELAGATDWRLPDIKQLYSLIDFSGIDPSNFQGDDTSVLSPFIDTGHFDFGYGDIGAGERVIDAQYASSTLYVSTTGNNNAETLFGVNFADGRIKGYGLSLQGQDKTFYVQCVRGNEDHGTNDFIDNGDGTVTDLATGLMWAQDDSIAGLNWEEALAWVAQQNADYFAGYGNWRLPNAKELQSLLDYTRSPDTTQSAAIDPVFNATAIVNEAGETDYPAYWTGTTHLNMSVNPGANAVYVNFGRALGYLGGWVDIHGAGAQRSDPKSGDPGNYPTGRGPQGDAIRIYNHVRLVRTAY
ncbi:MAG: sulfatase-like hydrolase/transferase, partial [Xanthomonadales bacterium]|nr:sulfatase-like hydrolase/transferase [Xanthomonadales bacterium]NIX13862.1 sulfatase-like hydrolase/transferase [Xanthomonadales bacterium]